LQPSKKDTKPRRIGSTSAVGSENNGFHSGASVLLTLEANAKTNVCVQNQDSVDHSKSLTGPNEKAGAKKNKNNSSKQQKAFRSHEMLRNRSMGHGSNNDDAELLHEQTLRLNSKSRASSVTRKAPKEVVGQLQRYQVKSKATNVYVAYLRFGPNPTQLMQLCEHPVRADAKSNNGEVPLKVLASSISTTDCDIRRGEWTSIPLAPYIIPGTSLVGVVGRIEQKKRSCFKEGDVVLGLVTTGGNARYASVPKDMLVRIPSSIDPCVAVCLCEIYLTAFQALHLGQRGNIRYRSDSFRGKSILILCGSSNLGHALIEVASAGGAEYCYALAKEDRHEGIRHRGGIPLPKNPDQWLTLIGRQIHILVVVADRNGLHTDDATPDHFKALHDDGHVIFISPPGVNPRNSNKTSSAASGGAVASSFPNPSRLMCKSLKGSQLERSNFFDLFDSWGMDPKTGRRDLEHLITMLEEERIRPVVLERVPLSKVAKVHSILETRRVPGFIVCAPWMHEPTQQRLQAISTSSTDSSKTFIV
jgi:NADPH:quinone reductase-like Zn-dependent oxidoreductase